MLPSRFSSAAIDRYWPTMNRVAIHWPTPVLVDPAPFSPETFSCRFRDAVKAITYHGMGTDTQYQTIQPIADSLSVATKGSHLLIGPRDALKAKNQTTAVIGTVLDAVATPATDSVDSPSDRILSALFTLLNHNLLSHFTVSNIDSDIIAKKIAECERPLEMMVDNNKITIF